MKAIVYTLLLTFVVSALPVEASVERQRLGEYELRKEPATKKRSIYKTPMGRQRTLDLIGHKPVPPKRQWLGK